MFRVFTVAVLVALAMPSTGCVIALGKWKVSSYDDDGKSAKKTVSGSSENTRITVEVQRQVAVHEAAHAIAMAVLFGEEDVIELVVNTREDDRGWIGHVSWPDLIKRRNTLEVNRKRAVVSLAARSADTFINGAPVSGSSTDLKHANDYITSSYISWGLGGTPMTYDSRAEAPKWMRQRILKDLLDAEDYADEIVQANIETIKALANDLMGITEKDDKRQMKADVFRAFCGMHVLKDPRATPPTDTSD